MTINDITKFVMVRARAASHPIFEKMVNKNKGKQEGMKGKRPFNGGRVDSFTTLKIRKAEQSRTYVLVMKTTGWHVAINSRECHSNSE